MNTIHKMIINCIDCDQHLIVNDPDPHDSFNEDDLAVLCKCTPNTIIDDISTYYSGNRPMEYRAITVSCRPYNKRKECQIPDWCPKLNRGSCEIKE